MYSGRYQAFTHNFRIDRTHMLQQMRGSMLRQTLHVRVARDTQKIQSSDWLI